MFSIKQRYTDPVSLRVSYCQFVIVLDERRSEDSKSISMEPALIAYVTQKDGENSISINPEKYLMDLIEAKRTKFCEYQTFLTKKCIDGKTLEVHDSSLFSVGDPIAVIGNQTDYFIVESVQDKQINISHDIKNPHYLGEFVQNLKYNIKHYPLKPGNVGIKSKLLSPPKIPFSAKLEDGMVKVMVQLPPNFGTIVTYDVYVRPENFSHIEPNWIPDAKDVSLDNMFVNIETYMGGSEAGGGKIENKTYYVGVVSKDNYGRIDVNESLPYVVTIR